MANFFDEERYTCECGSMLFKEVSNFMLLKDDTGKYSKVPCNKAIKCSVCGKEQHKINIKGE